MEYNYQQWNPAVSSPFAVYSSIQWSGVSNISPVDDMMKRLREPRDHAFNPSDHPDVLGHVWCVDCYPMSNFRYDASKHLYRIFEMSLGGAW